MKKALTYPTPGFHFSWPDSAVPEIFHIGERWGAGFFISDHTHEVCEFYYQVSGQSVWSAPEEARLQITASKSVGGDTARQLERVEQPMREYVLEPGGFFAVAGQVPHRMRERVASTQHFLYVAFDLDAVLQRHPSLKVLWRERPVVFVPHATGLQLPFRSLIREVSLQRSQRAVGMRLALDLLVVEATHLMEEIAPSSLISKNHAVTRARELMEEQPQRAWALSDLSRLTGVSVGHLVECFTREVGVPPHRFLLQARVDRACELLKAGDIPITKLALELGFNSSQHFASTFRKLTGKTPREFRNT